MGTPVAAAEEVAAVAAQFRAVGAVERRRKLHRRLGERGLDQHAAHAAAGAGDGQSDCHGCARSPPWYRRHDHLDSFLGSTSRVLSASASLGGALGSDFGLRPRMRLSASVSGGIGSESKRSTRLSLK